MPFPLHRRNARDSNDSISIIIQRARSTVDADRHPLTFEALAQLQDAVTREFPFILQRTPICVKRLRNKINYLSKKVEALQSQLDSLTSTKNSLGHLTNDWILKVILASPHASGRALADSFRLVAGFDSNVVSRPSIAKIKAAWVEMFLKMVNNKIRDRVAATLAQKG